MPSFKENIQKLLCFLYFCFYEDSFIPFSDNLALSFIQPPCPTTTPCIPASRLTVPTYSKLESSSGILTLPYSSTPNCKASFIQLSWHGLDPTVEQSEVASYSSALEKVTRFERGMCWHLLHRTHEVWYVWGLCMHLCQLCNIKLGWRKVLWVKFMDP